jgi:hypothetical protein
MTEDATRTYILLGPAGFYESRVPGTLGGNGRDRIYGRLDCGTALASMRRFPGVYAGHRVFFADEAAAIACAFRPCGNCMRAEYRAWREAQAREDGA